MADQFVDSGSGTAGTVQDAAHMDALVVAQSYLKSGGIPSTSGTLVATQPATEVVINRGDGTAIFLPINATTVTMTASSDNYVDVTTAGAYTVSAVSVGAAAPSQAAQTLRLYKATTSGTAITAVAQLATTAPVGGSMVQTGTANGVPSLDASILLTAAQQRGVRQVVVCRQTSDATANSTTQTTYSPTWTPSGTPGITTQAANSRLRVRWTVTMNTATTAQIEWFIVVNSVTYNLGGVTYVSTQTLNQFHGTAVTAALAVGTYTVQLQFKCSAIGGVAINASSSPADFNPILEIEEIL